MSQDQVPRPLVVSQSDVGANDPTSGTNDHEAGPSGTTHETPEEPAPTFDNSDDSESEDGPIFCHTPKIHTRSITAWRRD